MLNIIIECSLVRLRSAKIDAQAIKYILLEMICYDYHRRIRASEILQDKIFKNNSLRYSYYQIPFSAKKYIYSKYIFSILESENLLLKMNDTLSIFFREENPKVTPISFLRRIKTILNGTSNRENINKSLFIGK